MKKKIVMGEALMEGRVILHKNRKRATLNSVNCTTKNRVLGVPPERAPENVKA